MSRSTHRLPPLGRLASRSPQSRWTRSGAALLVCTALAACYKYVPAEPRLPELPADVRLRLSEQRAMEFTYLEEFGVLKGNLLSWDENGAVVLWHAPIGGTLDPRVSQRLTISTRDILSLEIKRLDRTRTALLAGGAVLAVTLFVIDRFGESGGTTRPGSPPPGDVSVVPQGAR